MKRKFTALALVMCLVLTLLLPGCGGGGDTSDGGTDKKNLGDVTVYSFYKAHFTDQYADNNATGRAAKRYEELYGGKVTEVNVPYAEYQETLTQMVSGNSAPDMVSVYGGDMPGWTLNILQPVDDYIDTSKLLHQGIVDSYRFQGKTYTLAVQQVQTYYIWYNKTLLEQNGVEEMPYDMWKNGTWTWDAFYDLAKQLTIDTNADGENDIWGFSSNDPQVFFYCNSAPLIDNNTFKVAWDSQACQNSWEFTKKLYADKILSKDDLNVTGGFENGQVAMAHGSFEYAWARSSGMDPSEIGVAPYPEGPDFNGNYIAYTNFFGIPKTAKNPEGAAALAELIAEEEKKFEMGFDLGNSEATDVLDEQAMEVIKHCTENVVVNMERGWGNFVSVFMECYNDIFFKGVNTKTALDSFKPKAQAAIDDILEQASKNK